MLTAFDTDVLREYTDVRWVGFHPPLCQHRWKCQISLLSNSLLPQMSLSSTFRDFLVKKWFYQNLLIFYTCKCTFGVDMPCSCTVHIPWEGGRDTGLGRSSSIWPNSRIFIKNPLARLRPEKFSKTCFKYSLQWKNCTRLLLTKWIWGPSKSEYTFSVTFCFPLPARLQWLEPAGRKQKSADVERKMYTLIYPDPFGILTVL